MDLSRVMYDFLTKNVGMSTKDNEFMILDQFSHNLAKGPLIIPILDSYLLYSLNKSKQLGDFIA